MVSVNLATQTDIEVKATVLGENSENHPPFVTFDIGPLSVILASAAQARKLAGELHRAADKLDGLPAWTPKSAETEIPF